MPDTILDVEVAGGYVLGINYHHDSSACLVRDGRVLVAIELERLVRLRHATMSGPEQVVNYCLAAAGLDRGDVVAVCANSANAAATDALVRAGTPLISHHLAHAYSCLATCDLTDAAIMVLDGSGNRYRDVEPEYRGPAPAADHFEEAESYYLVTGPRRRLEVVRKRWGWYDDHVGRRPYLRFSSLGHMYSVASEYIFKQWTDAGKVMGLAPFGTGESVADLVLVTRQGEDFTVSTRWVDCLPPEYAGGAGWGLPAAERIYQDVAWRVQRELEETVLAEARWLHGVTGARRLCVAGGVALNCSLNQRLRAETPFEEVFVSWAPADDGVALGCAFQAANGECGPRRPFAVSPYGGRAYADEEIRHVLDAYAGQRLALSFFQPAGEAPVVLRRGSDEVLTPRLDAAERRSFAEIDFTFGSPVTWRFETAPGFGRDEPWLHKPSGRPASRLVPREIAFRRADDPVGEAAELLARGLVVAWFTGGCEFGPRALGHRSILADPRDAGMTARVNALKGREGFRPVAPVVPLEHAAEYFVLDGASPTMSFAAPVRPERAADIPAVVHCDGSARLQTVTAEQEARLHALLLAFGALSGVPVLINTSLNDHREAIVETPADALHTFLRLGLDALVLEDWIVRPEA